MSKILATNFNKLFVMKQILSISAFTLTVLISACTKNTIENKAGISLPTVNNLAVSPLSDSVVHISWELPGGINENILQPLNVYLEVKKKSYRLQELSLFSIPRFLTILRVMTFNYRIPQKLIISP